MPESAEFRRINPLSGVSCHDALLDGFVVTSVTSSGEIFERPGILTLMSLTDRSAEIAALYQELILDHYRRPRNKGELEGATSSVMMKNPLCGDEIALHVMFEGDRVSDLRFSGRGCSISLASASMMTQLVKGKSADEIEQLRGTFRDMVMGTTQPDDKAVVGTLGSLRALSGVSRFPARVKCALLAWNALESAMSECSG